MAEERQAMNQDSQVVTPPAEVEAQARADGWVPKDQWRGRPEDWIDAPTFVERGREILPIVNSRLRRAEDEAAQLRQQNTSQASELAALKEQVAALEETSAEIVAQRVAAEKARLAREIKAAREAEDVDREIAATTALTKLEVAPTEPAKKPNGEATRTQPPQADAQNAEALRKWQDKYPSINGDPVKQAAAAHFAMKLAREGALNGLSIEARGDRIAQEVNTYFKQFERAPAGGRVSESGNGNVSHSNGAAGGGPGRRTYNDLPADARAACDKQAKRIVKTGTRFDTEQKFRDHYVKTYYADEA